MPFAMIGFSFGVLYEHKSFEWQKLIAVILCMLFARSAAMAFNRWLDANFDKQNPRTAIREIPAGIISSKNALFFVIANCILFIITTFFINTICFHLSPIALFVILFYSYTKRFTALCHLVLGVGLSLAPIGAFLAVTGYFHVLPILFSIAVFTWVGGFDIVYALQDKDFDSSQNLKSIPVWLGTKNAIVVSILLHVITAICIIAAGVLFSFNWVYWTGALIFIALLTYQHILVKPNDFSKINLAFFTTNGIASLIFSVFVIVSQLI